MSDCPSGWRLPTDEEWKALIDFFGGYYDKVLKEGSGDNLQHAFQALSEGGKSGFEALHSSREIPPRAPHPPSPTTKSVAAA
jgi:uncharacterized protein (TIGR02145 family)